MSRCRHPRSMQGHLRSAPKIVFIAAALLLAACQYAVMPQERPAPADMRVETGATAPGVGETAGPAPATPGLIQLLDPLDEPEYYCVDVPGFGRSLNLQGALTAHTCKPGADDEIFLLDAPSSGRISMPAYSLCMEASGVAAGATVHLADCAASPLQRFRYTDGARIRLVNDVGEDLCLTVASGAGEPTGGPSHLRRNLSLESCDQVEAARSRWTVGSATVVAGEPPTQE